MIFMKLKPWTKTFSIIGLVCTIATWYLLADRQNRHQQKDFEDEVRISEQIIEQQLDIKIHTIENISDSLQELDQKSVRNVLPNLIKNTLVKNTFIENIDLVSIVSQKSRKRFEKSLRREGYANFYIHDDSAGPRTKSDEKIVYFPIIYSSKHSKKPHHIGFNLGSDKTAQEILNKMLKYETPDFMQITARKKPASKANRLQTFAKLSLKSNQKSTLQKKQATGFIVATLKIEDMLVTSIPNQLPQGISLEIYEFSTNEREKIYGKKNPKAKLSMSKELIFADQKWEIRWYKTPLQTTNITVIKYIGSAGVLILFLSLTVIAEILASTSQAIRKNVAKHTAKIKTINKGLKKTNKELQECLHYVGHELHRPLKSILSTNQFILEDFGDSLDKNLTKRLQKINTLAEKTQEIADSLMEYSEVSQNPPKCTNLDINKLVGSVKKDLERLLVSQNAIITIPEPLPTVVGDPERLKQLFSHLIINAIQYNVCKSPKIEIGYTKKVDKNEDVFYIKDNGIGIPQSDGQKAFDIFQRVHKDDKYGTGAGLGLTIAQKIVEKHKGLIWIGSKDEDGTTIFFTLKTTKALSKQSSHQAA